MGGRRRGGGGGGGLGSREEGGGVVQSGPILFCSFVSTYLSWIGLTYECT